VQVQRSDAARVTEALIAHPAIRKIEFIGTLEVGKQIGATAAKYMKPVLMELGGKCPAIVLDDANMEEAADMCAKGGEYKSPSIRKAGANDHSHA
jgi:acyl-CoA reductase-like NAD-dependent aldehyde dehydrogenase